MRRFPTGRLFATFVLGALLEPVGHTAAYVLRYGPSMAWQLQSQGSHAAFPRVVSLSALSLLVALTLALLSVVSIRLILGDRRVTSSGVRSTFIILALVQCSLFLTKETLEAVAIQVTPDFVAIVILAVSVQLPLAVLAAWLISWIRGYLAMGAEAIRVMLALRVAAVPQPFLLRGFASPVPTAVLRDQRWYRRRGPPRFS